MYKLRDYQEDAINSLFAYFETQTGNPIIDAPTGSGKSIMIGEFCSRAIKFYPDTRIVVATHVKELIEQNFLKFCDMQPMADVGINSAGLKRRDYHNQILFTGIQSIYKSAEKLGPVDLLLVDEAHMIPRSGLTMWGKFIADLKTLNPHLKVVGFSATPYRMDSGSLTSGDGAIFDDICYSIPVTLLIERGYLCEPISKKMQTELDVSGVKKRGGEYVAGELQRAVNVDSTNRAVVEETMKWWEGRTKMMFFCAGVEHCHDLKILLEERGVKCAVVSAETPAAERDRILVEYKKIGGAYDCLLNVAVLTTGFDAPATDLLVCVRPTHSAGLWVQMLGRGMRISPETGKENCLVLDFAGNTSRHGPIDMIEPKDKNKKGGGEAPVKVCEQCFTYVYAGTRQCKCGFVFPEPEPEINRVTDDGPFISTQSKKDPPQEFEVYDVKYHYHKNPNKPTPTLKVEYIVGDVMSIMEWVCPEHTGFAREKATTWWWKRSHEKCPSTVEECLNQCTKLQIPQRIRAVKDGKFWKILEYMDFRDSPYNVPEADMSQDLDDEYWEIPL